MTQERTGRLSVCILISAVAWITSFVFLTTVYASGVYSNGYFRYTVEDYSVTIISYTGTENEVTVPNMIAGNPVNVIGKGAFVKNKSVTVIHLPDTIMSVEEDAFASGQKVIYDYEKNDSGSDEKREDEKKPVEENKKSDGENKKSDEGSHDKPGRGDDNGKKDDGKKNDGKKNEDKKPDEGRDDDVKQPENKDDNKKDDNKKDDNKKDDTGSKPDKDVKEDTGKTEDTPHIDVDNEDNLILVDKNGNEKVLDDTRAYRKRTDTAGNEIIEDIAGNVVSVTDSGTVEYTDKDNNKVSVNTRTGNKTVTAPDGSFGYEEVNIPESEEGSGPAEPDDKKIAAKEEAGLDNSKENEEDKPDTGGESATGKVEPDNAGADDFPLVTVVVLVIALAAVVYIVLFRRKKE